MTATVAGIHLGIDTHANRPAANTCPDGSMYSCSTHGLIYKSNYAGNSWSTWATLGGATVTDATIAVSDVTTNNASTSAHGWLKKLDNNAGHYMDGSGAWSTPAGSGATDLVQTYSGGGSVYIPGLRGHPDAQPASPGASDDEFDTTSTFATVLGTLDTNNVSDYTSHLHLLKSATGTFQLHGVYKAAPSMPFTAIMKINDFFYGSNYQSVGFLLGDATPTAWFHTGFTGSGGTISRTVWATRTSRSSYADIGTFGSLQAGPLYLKFVVTSSSSVALYYSHFGLVWANAYSAVNPGFTVSKVGIGLTGQDNSVAVEAAIDFVRFT